MQPGRLDLLSGASRVDAAARLWYDFCDAARVQSPSCQTTFAEPPASGFAPFAPFAARSRVLKRAGAGGARHARPAQGPGLRSRPAGAEKGAEKRGPAPS